MFGFVSEIWGAYFREGLFLEGQLLSEFYATYLLSVAERKSDACTQCSRRGQIPSSMLMVDHRFKLFLF